MKFKSLSEIRVGVIIAILTALFGVFLGFQGWVANTLYIQNAQISTLTTDGADTKTTTHEILSILLNKATISQSTALK
jgi:uncharacterized membrane protein affecting hemolysin expression